MRPPEPTHDRRIVRRENFRACQVPPALVAEVARHPRLRRSSAISRFAVLAGLNALRDAALDLDETSAARTALIFAISNGGVIYTRRFYQNIVESGAAAASPLLFPETVFNAPASHLAAILGITGATYTLVGDGAVGILALKMAEELMTNSDLDRCLVVGAEEADWLLCDASSAVATGARRPADRAIRADAARHAVERRRGRSRGRPRGETQSGAHPSRQKFCSPQGTRPGIWTRSLTIFKPVFDGCFDRERERNIYRSSGGGNGQKSLPGTQWFTLQNRRWAKASGRARSGS